MRLRCEIMAGPNHVTLSHQQKQKDSISIIWHMNSSNYLQRETWRNCSLGESFLMSTLKKTFATISYLNAPLCHAVWPPSKKPKGSDILHKWDSFPHLLNYTDEQGHIYYYPSWQELEAKTQLHEIRYAMSSPSWLLSDSKKPGNFMPMLNNQFDTKWRRKCIKFRYQRAALLSLTCVQRRTP